MSVNTLHCPIPAALSPHADAAQTWLNGWLDRTGSAVDPLLRRRAARAGFARYAARLYPDTDLLTLRTVSAMFTWFFLLDDDADTAADPDPERLRASFAEALSRLDDDHPARQPAGPLHRLLDDAWRTPRSVMPRHWRDRFVDAVRHHLDGVVAEAEAKAAGRAPTVDGYVRLRRATSAGYVAHVLGEYAAARPLPDAVHGHPAVRACSTAANDLLSLDRDTESAGGHNLVLVLAAERGLPTSEAVDAAAVMWRARMETFVGLRARVPTFGPALDVSVRHYLHAVERSVRGTIDWSLETVRYQPPPVVAPYLPRDMLFAR
jgi:hypothetical protein